MQQKGNSFQGTGGNPNIAGFQDHVINKYIKENGDIVFVDVTTGSNVYTDFETYLKENTYIICETGQVFNSTTTFPPGVKYTNLFKIN